MPELRIDSEGFRLDNAPFQIISGGLHYFRVHPGQWRDRLRKARLMGLNTVDTYVPWNLHEPTRGEFRMDGGLDLPAFLECARDEGLHVLLRPGPYICAEWEGGGLPSWLLTDPDLPLRTLDPRFMDAVTDFFSWLLPRVNPYLGTCGGPVLAVQVENEYGAFGDDTAYLQATAQLLRDHGVDVPLFTCDQPGDLANGGIPGILRSANFGSNVKANLATLRGHQPEGPLMCTEFWIGWFDRWGGIHVTRDIEDVAADLDALLSAGASVNMYMFHGGTNFGFTNGANDKHTYRPTVTSYDYDAPLDEAGDPTPKYTAFRDVIARHAPVPDEPVLQAEKKLNLLDIHLPNRAPLLGNAARLGREAVADERPLRMEQLGQDFGFVLYETTLTTPGHALLAITAYGDRAQVFVDGRPVGVLERESHQHVLAFTVDRRDATLQVLVENQGRVNYGRALRDPKGITGPVTLDGNELTGWTSRPLPLDSLDGLVFAAGPDPAGPGPTFHQGHFHLQAAADTFLDLTGWTKGAAWVNGFHLGRYWSRGPQRRLYVPGPALRKGRNELVVLELHATGRGAVDLRDAPDLGPAEE
ncbi:beta-galactosidase family protein [Streptomyces sp. NPDC002018]|uniref:glycoside hydrolase family 35 protein n=1 Tax=Streptomyces sp. NPDC002018 TaxID=3364629 RepID=UPI0036CEBE27